MVVSSVLIIPFVISTVSKFLILIFEVNCFISLGRFDLYLSVEYIGYNSVEI